MPIAKRARVSEHGHGASVAERDEGAERGVARGLVRIVEEPEQRLGFARDVTFADRSDRLEAQLAPVAREGRVQRLGRALPQPAERRELRDEIAGDALYETLVERFLGRRQFVLAGLR